MRHAADLLEAQDPSANAKVIAELSSVRSVHQAAVGRASAESVAIGVAAATLRMVAAAIDDEPKTEPAATRGSDGRFQKATTVQPEETR